jgi:hypothetical protein
MDFLDKGRPKVRGRPVVDSRAVSVWVVLTALLIGVVIAWFGIAALRAASGGPPTERPEVEDVGDLAVFLVCGECGTEFQVTRLGELQIPRHCGEPMNVVHRPRLSGG